MAYCLHLLDAYLHRTETFIWHGLRKSRRFPPLVLADAWENLDEFPLPLGEFLRLRPRRSWASRAWARLSGHFAQIRYPGGLEALRAREIAVCHAHNGFRAVATLDFTRALSKPLLVNFYGADVSRRTFLRRARSDYRRVFGAARFLLVEGPAMKNRLLELGAPEEKVRLRRIAIDPADYSFRERSWDGNRVLHLLFVGRLVEKKGLDTGLRALADPRVDFPWRLTVVGDGPLRVSLRALAESLGIADRVDFAGYRSLGETRADLQAHDLLLQPSRTAADGDGEGGAPTIVLEAQACGLPVLSTRHDDIPYVTVPERSAWLSPEGDAEALAYNLRRAAEEADRWGLMGKAGRTKIEMDHDANKEIVALEDLYAAALQG